MTTMGTSIGAPSTGFDSWDTIDWRTTKKHVLRLQMRIAQAIRDGRHGKAKALQWILTHSYSAKVFAVKRVTQNKGCRTAGVDGKLWTTAKDKIQAAMSMKRRGYNPQPLRRQYIPKKNGQPRPLGIPTMADRAQQALHLLALEPISEIQADANSYGFRPKRSTADAIQQCFTVLAQKSSAQWILEGDIKSCFDKISHDWLLSNVPADKEALRKWLTAGYIDRKVLHPTLEGTPQGGIISPTLANMTLDGLEQAVAKAAGREQKVNMIRYADDFVVTGVSRDLLSDKVKPAIENFLRERGLELSKEKTRITHIDEGFDFLGHNVRKYKGKLLIKPAKKSVKSFLDKTRETIKTNVTAKTEHLLRQLNPMIRGFANHFRSAVAKDTFSWIDHCVYRVLKRWMKRRHPQKSLEWRRKRYFRREGLKNWVFSTKTNRKGKTTYLNLFEASSVAIKRHIKIVGNATPYDPAYLSYFKQRRAIQVACRKREKKKASLEVNTPPH